MAVERIIELDDVRIVIWWCASSIMRCVREISERTDAAFLTPLSLSSSSSSYISGAVVETYASHQVTCSSSSRTSHIAPSFFLSSRHDVHRMPVRKRRVGFWTKKRHDWIGARVEGSKDIRIFIVRFAAMKARHFFLHRRAPVYNFFLMRYKAEYP